MAKDLHNAETPEELSLALTEPNREVAQYLSDLAQSTSEWVDYAQQKLGEGDMIEAARALQTVNDQVAEWQQSSALAMANNVALQEALSVAIGQRDELIREVETIQEERAWEVDEAFEFGHESGKEDLFTEIAEDPSIVEYAVDEAREHNLTYLIGQLRRVGNDAAAQILEERQAAAKGAQDELRRIEDDAREWYFKLPVEARIAAPTLEHEDELDDTEDGEDADDLDYEYDPDDLPDEDDGEGDGDEPL